MFQALGTASRSAGSMGGFLDRTGLSMSQGVSAAARTYGKPFAMEVAHCHTRYLAGDHDRLDEAQRAHYATSFGSLVFTLPTGAPWFVVVSLAQELQQRYGQMY